DKGDSEPMRTRSRRAAPGLALALALGLYSSEPAQAQAPAPGTPSPAAPSAPAAPPRPGRPTGPLRLTLAEATALALRPQPTIRPAQGPLVAAQARVPQARSGYYPRLDLQAGAQTSEAKSPTTGKATRNESTFATLVGRQLIYDFGKTAALVEAAQAG